MRVDRCPPRDFGHMSGTAMWAFYRAVAGIDARSLGRDPIASSKGSPNKICQIRAPIERLCVAPNTLERAIASFARCGVAISLFIGLPARRVCHVMVITDTTDLIPNCLFGTSRLPHGLISAQMHCRQSVRRALRPPDDQHREPTAGGVKAAVLL